MKTLLFRSLIIAFLSATSLHGSGTLDSPRKTPSPAVDPSKTPDGLSVSEWTSIRAAYEQGLHAIVANPDGSHQARNPGQAWLTKFDGRGFTVSPDAGGWEWGLELQGFSEVTGIRHEGGKLSYERGSGLTEWFVNDSRGLEQGWTLEKRLGSEDPGEPLKLHFGIRGQLSPQVAAGGLQVSFQDESGATALTYGGLKAWDCDGTALPVRFLITEDESMSAGLIVEVDDRDASYPITIDPIAQQQAYLKASNPEASDNFGRTVAVSGGTVVVGAAGEASNATGVDGNQADNSATNSGAVYVFVRNGTSWVQQAYLKASNTEASDNFGWSLAIAGDTVVVGANHEASNATGVDGNQADNSATNSGAVYVFVRDGTNWSQQAYLKASNTEVYDYFGESVAVSGDTVVVGAAGEASNATGVDGNQADNSAGYSGAAYVFVRNGLNWSQQAYLKASNSGIVDIFGISVAVSGDTVVVGAYYEASSATERYRGEWKPS